MFCIKGIKGLSKVEFGKIICLMTESSALEINTSNVTDILEANNEIYQDLGKNDYIIYEAIDKQINAFVGITANSEKTIVNHLYCGIPEMSEDIDASKMEACVKTASKLVNMIKVVAKTEIMTVVNNFSDNLIQLLQDIDFEYAEFEDDDRIWMIHR